MDDTEIRWHVLMVDSGSELAVVADLQSRGHDAYAPMETIWEDLRQRRRVLDRRQRERVRRPLFPGYVFATMEVGQSFSSVEALREVQRFVRFNGNPATVPIVVVESLRAAETMGAFDKAPEPGRRRSAFRPGQPARFVSGPWAGFVATVTRSAAKDRVRLMLEMFGRAAEIEVAEAALAPV